MARRPLRDILADLLKRQQAAAKPANPERSHFDPDEAKPEGKPDRRPARASQGRPLSPDPPRNPRTRQAPAQAGDMKKAFDLETDAKRIKDEQELARRFKDPRTRAAAIEAREDIQEKRDDLHRKYRDDMQAAMADVRRLTDDRRPAPPDAARAANRKFIDLAEQLERDMARLDTLQLAAFAQLDVMNVKLENWGPNKLRLGTSYKTDPTGDFNEAAGEDIGEDVVDAEWHDAVEEDDAIPVQPEPAADEADPADEAEAPPPVDFIAEFNKHRRPPDEGSGIRP